MIEFKEKGVNIAPIFKKLREIVISVEGEKVNFHAFEYDILTWVVLELLKFEINIPFEYKLSCLNKTLTRVVLEKRFEKNYLIELLIENVNKCLKAKEETYILAAEISISNFTIKDLKFEDVEVSFLNDFPDNFQNARAEIGAITLKESTKVLVRVKGKDILSAQNKAFKKIEVIRAMLNLLFNHLFSKRIGFKTTEPINRVRFFEYITLHNLEGKIANENSIWHIINYIEPKIIENSMESDVEEYIIKQLERLTSCRPEHKDSIVSALTYYARAFDESNPDLTFVNSWRILEILTSTDTNDILIKRVSAHYKKDIKAWVVLNLKALRNYRNEFIHVGPRELDSETACFLLQDFIRNLVFNFNLKHAGVFNSMVDAAFYLDKLNLDNTSFDKQFEILNLVKKTRNNQDGVKG